MSIKKYKHRRPERRKVARRRTLLIPEWKRAYRFASNWIIAAIVALSGVYEYAPTVQKWLPDSIFHWTMTALGLCAILARMINQAPKG